MESNGIGNNDAATLALLGGGYNGIGIGNNRNYGTDVLAAGTLADGTAAKASSEAHSSQLLAAVDRLGAQSSDTQIILREEEVNKNITDSEFRAIAREQTIQAELVDNAKEAAKCCCEAKLEAQKNACDTQRLIIEKAAATDALILAVEGRSNLDKLAESRAENTYLKTIQEFHDNNCTR